MRKREKLEQVLPGMSVYADGLISSEIIPNRQIKAVVGYVAKGKVYAVCLKETELPWSSDYLFVPETKTMVSGKEATQKILEALQTQGKKAEAAQWCHDYAEDGVKPGEAFLPSLHEWKKILANRNVVNASLKHWGKTSLQGDYWSSIEANNYLSFVLEVVVEYRSHFGLQKVNCSNQNYYYKDYASYVRPVISFEL